MKSLILLIVLLSGMSTFADERNCVLCDVDLGLKGNVPEGCPMECTASTTLDTEFGWPEGAVITHNGNSHRVTADEAPLKRKIGLITSVTLNNLNGMGTTTYTQEELLNICQP